MDSLFANVGFELPLALFLMAIFGLRTRVWPRASLFIQATPEVVFRLVDMVDGKREDWGRVKISAELVDRDKGHFKKTYRTMLTTGVEKTFYALFAIRNRVENERIEIVRAGIEGKSPNNELLSQTFVVTPEGEGCRLAVAYEWGPRPIIAQLVARADLWGGIFRLKGLAEKGIAVEWPYLLITVVVSFITAALSLAAFALFIGWTLSALLIFALFVHELGHLLAYRMMGQPWGRMIFLPFLGAVAMPRLPFDTQGQMVFAALMGPGFSILLAFFCAAQIALTGELNPYVAGLGGLACVLNLFNMLPTEPLDGGIALRSVLGRYMGKSARFGLMAVGIVLIGIGLGLSEILFVIFGGIAVLANFKDRAIDVGLMPMRPFHAVLAGLSYVTIVAVYLSLLQIYFPLLDQLQS